MNIQKNSITFKANFKVAGAEYFSKEEWDDATLRAPTKTQQVLDFLFYMNSEQAKQILKSLPEEDTVELYILKDTEDIVKIEPYLYYSSNSIPKNIQNEMQMKGLDITSCHPKYLKSRFRLWAKQIDYFIQSSMKKNNKE